MCRRIGGFRGARALKSSLNQCGARTNDFFTTNSPPWLSGGPAPSPARGDICVETSTQGPRGPLGPPSCRSRGRTTLSAVGAASSGKMSPLTGLGRSCGRARYKDIAPGGAWNCLSNPFYKDAAPSGAKADACSEAARTFSTFLSPEDRCACRFCSWLEGRGTYRQNVS
jgi:hypothetical protein